MFLAIDERMSPKPVPLKEKTVITAIRAKKEPLKGTSNQYRANKKSNVL
jgi:hypothetical protein